MRCRTTWFWPSCVALSALAIVLAGAVVGQARGGTPAPASTRAFVPAAPTAEPERDNVPFASRPTDSTLEWRYTAIR